jgi:hypothetical protein
MRSLYSPAFTALWTNSVYFLDENWDRLRVMGSAQDLGENFAELTFVPFRQKSPAADERTDPQMKDPVIGDILGGYNTIYDLCEFADYRYRCNILELASDILGMKLKYLLRKSISSYPTLFQEPNNTPTALATEDDTSITKPNENSVRVVELQAYNNQVVISGGPIANADDWPKGFAVKTVDYSKAWSFKGIVGQDIVLPSAIGNTDLVVRH